MPSRTVSGSLSHTDTARCSWGSPHAPRRALLIHGMSMCAHSWEGIAQLLVAEGFFVVAPNLLGHAWRRGSDYSVSALAKDLQSYFVMDMSYDVIIGHSMGGTVTLSLLPFLPKHKEVTVILVDPAIDISEELLQVNEILFIEEVTRIKTPDEHMAENPTWSRNDCILRTLGLSMCDSTVIKALYEHNKPWSFGGLFKNITPNMKVNVLLSDPAAGAVCLLENLPSDVKGLSARVVTGAGHWIHFERPNAIMDAVPLPRANL